MDEIESITFQSLRRVVDLIANFFSEGRAYLSESNRIVFFSPFSGNGFPNFALWLSAIIEFDIVRNVG